LLIYLCFKLCFHGRYLPGEFVIKQHPGIQKQLFGFGPRGSHQPLPAFDCRQPESRETFGPRKRLQLIRYRRALAHQRLSIVQQIEYLSTFRAPRHYCRKLPAHQQIENRLRITKIILVPRERYSSDHPRIAHLQLDPKFP
jgi:hypothetical protein